MCHLAGLNSGQLREVPVGVDVVLEAPVIYSDGAYELTRADERQWPISAFVELCARLDRSPDWTLDDVIDNALSHSASGSFDDECCLVRLTFD